jgi:hypothetical protein
MTQVIKFLNSAACVSACARAAAVQHSMPFRHISPDLKERAVWLKNNGWLTANICNILGISDVLEIMQGKSPYLLSTTSYLILQQPGSSVGRAPGICPRGPGFKPQSGHFFSRSHDSQHDEETGKLPLGVYKLQE